MGNEDEDNVNNEHYDYYYFNSYYNNDGYNFDGYVAQSRNPDYRLVVFTVSYILICIVVGLSIRPTKRRKIGQNGRKSGASTRPSSSKDKKKAKTNANSTNFVSFDSHGFIKNDGMDDSILLADTYSTDKVGNQPYIDQASNVHSAPYEQPYHQPSAPAHNSNNEEVYYEAFDDYLQQYSNTNPDPNPNHISPKGHSSLVQSTGRSRTGKLQMMKQMHVSINTIPEEDENDIRLEQKRSSHEDSNEWHEEIEEQLKEINFLDSDSGLSGLDDSDDDVSAKSAVSADVWVNDPDPNKRKKQKEGKIDLIKRDFGQKPASEKESTFTLCSEMQKILSLALPWSFSSSTSYISSIIAIASISHNMGLAEMLCYSYVWLIIDTSHVISTALYGSTYKHVSNAVSLDTSDGYSQAGKYIRIGVFYNVLISVPTSIALVRYMPMLLSMFGYSQYVTALASDYTLVAVVTNFISTSSGFVSMIPDQEGHADFDAMWNLVDSAFDIILMLVLVPHIKPSLVELGIIQLVHGLLSTVLYYAVTIGWKKWYAKYHAGLFSSLTLDIGDQESVGTLVTTTLPMAIDAITDQAEWFILTFIATRIGPAESATWILSSYIWGIVTVLPNCVSSAAEYSVARILSLGNSAFASRLCSFSLVLAASGSIACAIILYFSKGFIVTSMTLDQTLQSMLMEVIPYLVFCQPLISIVTTISYLNRALGMYQKSTAVDFFVTCLVTVPSAIVVCILLKFNVEGLVCASFIGYGSMAILTLVLYRNADMNQAVEKNMKMSGNYSPTTDNIDSQSLDNATSASSTFSRKVPSAVRRPKAAAIPMALSSAYEHSKMRPTSAENNNSAAIPIGAELGIVVL